MNTLVFDTSITGHHLEYIHHLYLGMMERKDIRFLFVIPDFNKAEQVKYSWPKAENIEFDFLSEKEVDAIKNCSLLFSAWRRSKLVRKKAKEHHADSVFLIMLMAFMPFILFMLPSKVKLSGIIYRIYLYEWKELNWAKSIKDVISNWFLSHSKHIDKIFILNDSSAVAYLNKLYKTNHFAFLPDPFNKIDYESKNIRKELGIKRNQKMLLHFGGLSRRKGTITILDSIPLVSESIINQYVFVFAGIVYPDIRKEFYEKVSQLNDKVHIVLFDGFCSNERLYDLCYSCDLILVPYSNTSQSSGIVNYADYFQKSILGPRKGLLGKLIRKRQGIAMDRVDAASLASILSANEFPSTQSVYKEPPSISDFYNRVL